ncbi:MAG TPA: PHP domain-containing protein [Gammaproteobacteria bacterium]|nr:PHP domain-containing protein [Gammaproteobacteria bacterium]
MIDLHTHSAHSDGTLAPEALVALAAGRGVKTLALTDHDTLAGIPAARAAAAGTALRLVSGVEVSVSWEHKALHVVGLDVDPGHPALMGGLARLQEVRDARAVEIGRKLEAKGVAGAYAGALALAGEARPTRTHFARFLHQQGHVKDEAQAYRKFLGRGKPAHVSATWASLQEAIGWIHAAGGQAVLAHPFRYDLTRAWLVKVLTAFKQAGGDAMEVVSGRGNPDEFHTALHLAQRFELAASVGSDFHAPATYSQPGVKTEELPMNVPKIWERFRP